MSTATASPLPAQLPFMQMPIKQRVGLLVAVAAGIAALAVAFLWAREPEYRVLFSNITDKDGGAIVAQLEQQKVPYKYSEGGGAILVPADKVHDLRLKLASQGLPKGGSVGFELMENQKFGVTQFQEQVNYQRAMEGELARSIQTVAGVQAARVHLAIPRQTAFLREQDKPRASVLVTLAAGRTLDRAQVAGIAHLVSSSVPELALKNVSVVDQNGNLLSNPADGQAANRLSAEQLSYVREIEAATIKRIEDILEPILGKDNVRAQVTADVDFTLSESTAETYKPNQDPTQATVRSSRTSDNGAGGAAPATGVPGAASNQAGVPAPAATASTASNANIRRDATVNYEVDKTVKVTRATPGTVKRLSAAVVVNHRKVTANGKTTFEPLSADDVTQLNALVKEAMGFQQPRGDSLNLVNTAFTVVEPVTMPEVPLWKQPENIALAKEGGKFLLLGMLALFVFFSILRPALRQITAPPVQTLANPSLEIPVEGENLATNAASGPQGGLLAVNNGVLEVRQIAKSDPKIVANVVKTWVAGNE
ncbi:MAG: flagellar basal-body MS-ring/collar protein FliF [Burkholderiales bacterium]|nr:flagellar basal-body MS-ring/collar protein FliF [Burkholderiales bacterium]